MSNLVDTVLVFRILKKLTTPFEKMPAYKEGVIDKKGNVLVSQKDRTPKQKKVFTMLDRLVLNLKKTLGKVPGGSSQIGSYVAALALIKEYVERETNKETSNLIVEKLEEYKLAPFSVDHDLSTVEGFMDAWEEEMVREMTSGAAIGGAFDGAQTNADANATGMAAPTGPTKKKKKNIEKIIQRRL